MATSSISLISPLSSVPSAPTIERVSRVVGNSGVRGSSANQNAGGTVSSAGAGSSVVSTSIIPTDAVIQDLVLVLKALVSGDVSSAQSSLAKLRQDLTAEATASSGAEETESSSALSDPALQTDAAIRSTAATSTAAVSPFDALVGKLSFSLYTGSASNALKDVTNLLVQSGQGIGNLVNTFA